jgi:leucyl aminopeptidase
LKIEVVENIENSFQIIFGKNDSRFDLGNRKVFQKVEDLSDSESFRIAGAEALQNIEKAVKLGVIQSDEVSEIAISEKSMLAEVVEGILLSNYSFTKYKSKVDEKPVKTLKVKNFDGASEIVERSRIIVEATNFTRDIVNSMPDEMTPKAVAKLGEKLAQTHGLEALKLNAKDLEKQKMGLFSAVGRASAHPPYLLKVAYRPENAKKKVLLIGKGLTYDSGGLSLKPAEYMKTMKSDKSGASAVLGALKAISELKLNVEVVGFLGLAENMIGGNAYKPDDVLMAMNGKSVEIGNTDAEGRLVLADTLTYAQKTEKDFDYIIDVATLTGASVVGLGEYTSAIMGNSDEVKNEMLKAGDESGEYFAVLPFNRYLRKLLDSQIADISNIAKGRYGGALTAGLFLNEFIKEKNKNKWIHLDIAGASFVESSWGYNPAGASGKSVRTLTKFVENLEK